MAQGKIYPADIPEIFEESSTSSEEIEVQEQIKGKLIKKIQSIDAKNKYLLNFKRWPIFEFLELEFILQIRMAMIFFDQGILIVTKDKKVYGFGNNKNKCLGIGDTDIALQPKKVEELCGKNIKKFVYNRHGPRMFALTEEGKVYSWGNAKEPGLGHTFYFGDKRIKNGVTLPTQISKLKRIIDIKCSDSHSLALTNNGEVYIWGNINESSKYYFYQDTPKQIQFKNKKIVQIACGKLFSIARSDEGKLYTWGENIFDVSATSHLPDKLKPHQIKHLNEEIIKVCCGTLHVLVLTIKGKIYVWGSNYYGQLGLDERCNYLYPTLLPMPEKVLEIAIKQDGKSNIALCKNGYIYIWGEVTYFGQMCSRPTITSFLNMHEALMFNNMPLTVFADDLKYMDEEMDVLECWETLFDKPEHSSSDLIIQVEGQPIHVHKAILKKRSSYFRTMFQDDSIKNQIKKEKETKEEKRPKTDIIKHSEYSYIVYKAFLKYLYTDIIDLDIVNSIKKLLELLDLAIVYCENKLEIYCILEIKRQITIRNVASIYNTARKHNKKDLIEFCCNFTSKQM